MMQPVIARVSQAGARKYTPRRPDLGASPAVLASGMPGPAAAIREI
jgi:hypothetical protein